MLVAAAGLAMLSAPAGAVDLIIGTSSPGGSYFLMGGGLSVSITKNVKGVTLSTQTTAGSTTNMRLLAKQKRGIDLGLANLGAVYNAWTATGKFKGKKKVRNVRALFTVAISPMHWVTLAKDNILTFNDFAGKRISMSKAGSGTAANADTVLRVVGVRDKIKATYLGFSESADNLRDGNIDAFAISSSVPAPAVSALAATRKVRLISLSKAQLKGVMAENPAFAPYTIKAKAYGSGVTSDALSYGVPSTVMATDKVPADVIYKIVKHVFSAKTEKYMKTVYRSWSPSPSTASFKGIGIPHHPGAVKAFKELGLM